MTIIIITKNKSTAAALHRRCFEAWVAQFAVWGLFQVNEKLLDKFIKEVFLKWVKENVQHQFGQKDLITSDAFVASEHVATCCFNAARLQL